MQRLWMLAFPLTLALSAVSAGCGSSACDDYEEEVNSCCEKAPGGTTCSISVPDGADDDACEAAQDIFKCPY